MRIHSYLKSYLKNIFPLKIVLRLLLISDLKRWNIEMSHNKFPLVILFLFVSGCGGGGGSSSVPSAPPVSNPDTTKPVISVPSTLTVVAPNGSGVSDSETEIAAFLAAATASDNVDSNV